MASKSRAAVPWVWLGVAGLGVAARLWLWWTTFGSNDSAIWGLHGQHVLALGLRGAYETYVDFNHPPLMGLYSGVAWAKGAGQPLAFARLIKLPGLVGEALSLWGLWRFASPRAAAAYALVPVSILVSGFHGSTDCLYAAFIFLAAVAFDRERYFLSGLLWSAALNVKVLPIVLVPIVLLAPRDRRSFLRLVAGGALGLLPFVPPLLVAAGSMYRNMLVYNSQPNDWGVLAFLNAVDREPRIRALFSALRTDFIERGRYLMLASITGVALLSRFRLKLSMTEQTALGAALFFVFAPGFGVQYLVLLAPVLCFVELRAGLWWGWLTGVFAALLYGIFLRPDFRPPFAEFGPYPQPAVLVGVLAWAYLLQFVWARLRDAWVRTQPVLRMPAAMPLSVSNNGRPTS
ncbi:MAG: hypothetical protein ACJ8AT_13795 [Hyalangium sp.]|uniref:hypothetical protein n=1 Tax=Hyalangium sp. TaxID=2028555 RepID=UPI00389AAC68